MTDRIKIQKSKGTWVVRAGGAVLAETRNAVELAENGYPGVIYFPRADVAMEFLESSEKSTRCPFKGRAKYYSIHTESKVIPDAVWTYEDPLLSVADIAGHLAFYTDLVTVEQV